MQQTTSFDVPVGIFFFNRPDLFERVLTKVAEIKPSKLYLMCDGPRMNSPKEIQLIDKCKKIADQIINWKCEVYKDYHPVNVGVYQNIAGGAKWVFSKEEMAIFLEDDNLPDGSFFEYCRQMLLKYSEEEKVLIIFGNNFLVDYKTPNDESYIFTQHLHPCGWASWSNKFLNNYDWDLNLWTNAAIKKEVLKRILYIPNKSRYYIAFSSEFTEFSTRKKFSSWDFHCYLTLLAKDLLAIVPKTNLIRNIGVDERATHGSVKLDEAVSKRVPQQLIPLEFPLIHPDKVEINYDFEIKLYKLLRPTGLIYTYFYYFLIIKRIFGYWGVRLFNIILKFRLSIKHSE
jgi:hypothetical protein